MQATHAPPVKLNRETNMTDGPLIPSDAFDESRIMGDVVAGLRTRGSELVTSAESSKSLQALVAQLCDTLAKDTDSTILRSDAAWALGQAAASSKRYCGGYVPVEILSAVEKLSAATAGERTVVRRAAIVALGEFGTSASRAVVDAIAAGPFAKEPYLDVQLVLATLQRCNPDDVQTLLAHLRQLLTQGKTAVQISVLNLMERLGDLPADAALDVLDLFENCDDRDVRESGANALSAIAGDPARLFSLVKDLPQLRKIAERLDSSREPSKSTRRSLFASLARFEQSGPPDGFRAMRIATMIKMIFGDPPDEQESEVSDGQWNNTQEKKIKRWIKSGELRGFRVHHGLYYVAYDDIKTLSELHHGT